MGVYFQQYFSCIVAVSCIGGRNRITSKVLLNCHKWSAANFIILCWSRFCQWISQNSKTTIPQSIWK